tara:strand:+ start:10895 stop:11839 length:945 start_codon:yes stop_codon:yes gene_type:complete
MKRQNLTFLIGLAGVAPTERPRARRWGKWFEAPMLVLAMWMIIEWYLRAKGVYPENWAILTDRAIWLFFVTETVVLSILVRNTRHYLKSNWLNLGIIALGIPLFWNNQLYVGILRSLRILLIFGILFELSGTIRKMLAKNNIGLTLFVSLIIIVMAGIWIAAIDPAIDTPWDGIWWAWVTVTTVGYGDLVPDSPQGRIFGGVLMILGLGLFSLITASFSAFLISREEAEIIEKEEDIIEKQEEIIAKERRVASKEGRVIAQLNSIEDRLGALERNLDQLINHLSESTATSDEKAESKPEEAPSEMESKSNRNEE